MGIKVRTKGSFKKMEIFLERAKKFDPIPILHRYGETGVDMLKSATPVDTGLTANSWYYEIEKNKNGYRLRWNNSNVVNGLNIAILIQYGHATTGGTYVQGVDYINPALQDIFNTLAIQLWREVSK